MNLPNKLTILRVCMIPLFLALYFLTGIPGNYLWALAVFSAASLTDMADGRIARSQGLITDFGKLMDPLADKLLVISAMVCLLQGSSLNLICLILVISRELLVTSIRLLAAGKGIVIPADIWGKLKTVTQMVWICLSLLHMALAYNFAAPVQLLSWLGCLVLALFGVMMVLSVVSGLHYLMQNRSLFSDA